MAYAVKEISSTLQGERRHAASGRGGDCASAACTFCNTDFVGMDGTGSGHFADAEALDAAIDRTWEALSEDVPRLVVLTGGEPVLQVDGSRPTPCTRWASRSRSRPTAQSRRHPASTGSARRASRG